MIHRHPDREMLERFLDGVLANEASRVLQRHLFVCPECEERLLSLLPEPSSPEAREEDSGLIHRLLESYRVEISRRRRGLAEERSAAAALWRDLEPHDPMLHRLLVSEDRRFHSWVFFELLLERSFRTVLTDANEAEEILRLALDVAERLPAGEHGSGSAEAAKARAWTHLGNTLRVRGELRLAEAAFDTAELHLSRSWLDPLDEALLLEFRAPLRRAQRRFVEALELIEGAIAIYREVNEPHLQGRALMIKGVTLLYKGNFAEAAECFRDALPLLEEPRLLALSRFNLVVCLQDAGQSREAAVLIPETRRGLEQWGARCDLLRLRWTEGKVAASMGRPAEAEAAFLKVRRAFIADSLAFDAALISLDLAALYLRQGRPEETKRLAVEIVPIFQSQEVYRDALAAVIVFQRAAEMEQLTLGVVEEVGARLREISTSPQGVRSSGD